MSANIIGIFKSTGLIVTIDIRRISDNSLVIDSDLMIEMSEGAYKYVFTTFDEDEEYLFICKDQNENKVFAVNQVDTQRLVDIESTSKFHLKLEKNKAVISENGLHVDVYDDDGITILHKYNLSPNKKIRTPE